MNFANNKKGSTHKREKEDLTALILYISAVLIMFAAVVFLTLHGSRPSDEKKIVSLAAETESKITPDKKEIAVSDIQEKEDLTEAEPSTKEIFDSMKSADAEKILENMTIKQKVAQMFMISPEALTSSSNVTQAGTATKNSLINYPIGGILYHTQNLVSEKQLQDMTAQIQQYALEVEGIELFLAIDEEGGEVARISGSENFPSVPKFENMSEIGDSGNSDRAYEVGSAIGSYLKEYGINMDFAPVADVITNPNNKVVKKRSFGSEPVVVSDMVERYRYGLEEHEVYGVIKHFPGHGGTAEDTHNGYAQSDKTYEDIKNTELIPFQRAIDAGVDCIMVSHISMPKVTGDGQPSSLSEKMIHGILREQMGFKGVVITDALNMNAIQKRYNSSEAAVQAIKAGADILLTPADFQMAYEGVLKAVENNEITEERIDESVLRILQMKNKW